MELVSLPHFLHDFFLHDDIFLMFYYLTEFHCLVGYLFFVRYCAICALQLFGKQVVTS